MRDARVDANTVKRVDGYRPVWKDESDFPARASTNAVVVEVRGALKTRAFVPAKIELPDGVVLRGATQIDAFVTVAASGVAQDAFVERGSGDAALDGAVVRALEGGRAQPGDGDIFGRVSYTVRNTQ